MVTLSEGLKRRAADVRPPWLRAIRRAAAVAADTKLHESELMELGIQPDEVADKRVLRLRG